VDFYDKHEHVIETEEDILVYYCVTLHIHLLRFSEAKNIAK